MSKKDKVKCQGITNKKSVCFKFAVDETKYCKSHSYLHEFTDEMIQEIINDKTDKYKFCNRCSRWHTEKVNTCANCTKISSEKARIKQANKIKEKVKNGVACSGLHKDGSICGFKISQNGYCKNHLYMIDYTNEMKKVENLQQCSACKRYVYFGEFKNNKTCLKCRNNSFEQRTKIKNEYIPCRAKECNFKQCPKLNNGYCGKHQKQKIVDDAIRDNKVLCSNHTKQACYNILPDNYEYKQCESCRINEREKYNKHKIDRQIIFDKKRDLIEIDNNNEYMCIKCPSNNCMFKYEDFYKTLDDKIDTMCKKCRDNERLKEKNRKPRDRTEYYKNYVRPEESIQKRKEYYINNYDKHAKGWMDKRQQKINDIGVDEYLRLNAEKAKEWRRNNPDKVKEINERKRKDPNNRLKYYKLRAEKCGIKWNISDDDAKKLFNESCYYCKEINELNGIDRLDNDKDYELNNIVSCCTMCNMMKKDMSEKTFYNKIIHILSNFLILDKLCYSEESFQNHYSATQSVYKKRAINKNIEYLLNDREYNIITNGLCYMCNKSSSKIHINGIDRIDNNKSYKLDNCLSCCGDCNFIKNKYNIYDLIIKMYNIVLNKYPKYITNKLDNYVIECFVDINIYINKYIIENKIHDNEYNPKKLTIKKSDRKIIKQENENKDKQNNEENNKRDIERIRKQIYRLRNNNGDENQIKNLEIELNELRNNEKYIVKKRVKMTKEEIKERNILRKQKKREELVARYNDEEYKLKRANELKMNKLNKNKK